MPTPIEHHIATRRFARPQRPLRGGSAFRRDAAIQPIEPPEAIVREVEAAKRGDRDALGALYLRYKDNVYGYVCSIVRDEHEAEDVTQQVFAKMLRVLPAYEPRGDVPFSGWLLRVARNAAIDHLRERRPVPQEQLDEIGVIALDGHLVGLALHAALLTLPEEQRRVVVMRHIVGLSPPEIAERLGRSESSVHALHHRGRQRLRRELRATQTVPACSVPAAEAG